MKKILASLALLVLTTSAHAGFFPTDLSENTTGAPDTRFLGAPDNNYYGIGGQIVTYDFGFNRVVNRAGAVDFNVYEYDTSTAQFGDMDVLVSNDGIHFDSVKLSEIALTNTNRIIGDSAQSLSFSKSYDLGSYASVRYIRIDGVGTGSAGNNAGFDLDAIGAHEVTAVPEPESYAMIMAGLGLLGFTARRMKRKTSA